MHPAASTSELRFALALAALALLAACGPSPDRVEQLHVFGTLAELRLRDAPPGQAQASLAEIAALLNQREREWHAWQDSDLTRINAAFARGEAVEAPDSVVALLRRSQPLSEASDGLFDPAIGGLVGAWGFHTSSFPIMTPVPSDSQLQAWREQRPRITEVRVDGRMLSTPNPRTQLDFDAVAEGAAAEEVLAILRRHGIRHALVNLGGDVVALAPAGAAPWQVSLRDPFGGVLGSVALGDAEALFTSGNYNKFRQSAAGARQPHILDPRTARPARGTAAVVVLHADPVLADAAASALFVAGPSGFEAMARRLGLGCALMVTDENELLVTMAMKARLTLLRDPVPLGPPLDLGPACVAGPAR
ncbi:FAD:protein FMN transferase [Arenimonas caeni]|jgi:thiamine biosynthesis lipoprotein|uniref:FAD:protein FMN transferase n=1 Tax=Arenimonas caeni TaxID=2058085 RepID=A0A2P6MAJ0_9GAMM|nr:FAD:protein FMN transferase [Arenimonas caeni]MDY0022912.1 FAD:protein FMN transferase [Arenimonas caeni]PRH82972.1 FAD:protein FMN transferase [Arenimonas caeni]